MRITHNSIHKKIATLVIACGLVVLGIFGLSRLPVTFLPDVTYPLIKVHIWWNGATPEEIDKNLADPIERVLATVDGVSSIESSSIEGMYNLMLNFRYGVDVDVAYQDTLAAMARVQRQLPKDIDAPLIMKADPTQLPVSQITVRSSNWDMVQLRTWTENWLQNVITAVPGVAGTEILGGLKREIRVYLDPDALFKHELSIAAVINILRTENVESSIGRVTQGREELVTRVTGEYKSLEDIRNIVISRQGHARILLRDVASIVDSHQDKRIITRLNGTSAMKLNVLKQADANTVAVATAIDERLESLKDSLPDGVELGVVENQAVYVKSSINGVRNASIEAAVLVVIVIFLFLGSWRQAVVMSVVLPVTLAINFGLMQLAGFSLNIFSLGGLVVAIGVVLDNATVVLENITRIRHEQLPGPIEQIAELGTSEVGSAILAATLSFMALFVPFLLVQDLTTLLFKEFILVIAGIVVLSLGIALTLVPMLSSVFMRNYADADSGRFDRFFVKVSERYGYMLEKILIRRKMAIAVFSILAIGGFALAPRIGSEFLPQMDDGRVMIKVKLPVGASVAETENALLAFEKLLEGDPVVESYFMLAGGKVWGTITPEIAEEGQIDVQLVPRKKRKISTQGYIKTLRGQAKKIQLPRGKAMVMQQKVRGIRKLGDAEIEVKISGQDLRVLAELAQKTLTRLNQAEGLTNTYISLNMKKPEYQVHMDRVRAAELGVSVNSLATAMRSLVNGVVATRFRDAGEYYDVRLMVPELDTSGPEKLEALPVRTDQGAHIRVGDIAKVVRTTGPVEITRENQVKQVVVRADTMGISVGEGRQKISEILSENLPAGYGVSFGGQAQMMDEMRSSFTAIMLFALFFSFVVLAVQFNSLRQPFLILMAIPFCASGMAYALFFTGIPIGATVIIGALIVIASTVNEGVLLITYAEDLRLKNGLSPFNSIVQAGKIRLRPRLMVAVTVIVGLIPLALNLEEGGEMLQPMAVSAIGGLLLGIFVALFMVPCLYLVFTPGPMKDIPTES